MEGSFSGGQAEGGVGPETRMDGWGGPAENSEDCRWGSVMGP